MKRKLEKMRYLKKEEIKLGKRLLPNKRKNSQPK